MSDLQVVLVTPEKTLFDRPVQSVRLPLFDGSAGFYPGRAPLVGRLGVGELRLEFEGGAGESLFIDGGFVQVKGSVVSVLTNAAVAAESLNLEAAKSDLAALSSERVGPEDSDYADHLHRSAQARTRISLASRK